MSSGRNTASRCGPAGAGLRVLCWSVLLLLLACTGSAFEATGSRSYALLVGCTDYPALDRDLWLNGPANDVKLWRQLLSEKRFGFEPNDIVELAGWPEDPSARPTRDNIAKAFAKLARLAGPGDQVVVLLAGHGSQQPDTFDDEEEVDKEIDGLDEIFLPADARGWNGDRGRIENAIVDDEIRGWLTAIRNKGAFVWFVADTCHSGTLTRGAPRQTERERRIPVDGLVPREALERARRSSRSEVISSRSSVLDLVDDSGDLVALYAARPEEITTERPLPGPGDEYHGVFSYTIAKILSDSQSPLTYRELAERVAGHYRATGRFQPSPLVEGSALDREVLGVREWTDRPDLLLGSRTRRSGMILLRAGDLHGLRPGSVLAVYPPAGKPDSDRLVGYVRVAEVEALRSYVEPVAYRDIAPPDPARLVAGSRCAVIFVDYGDFKMHVALQTQESSRGAIDPVLTTLQVGEGPKTLETAWVRLAREPHRLVERVTDPSIADWFVRMVGDELVLVPAAGWLDPAGGEDTRSRSFMLGRIDQGAATGLPDALRRIARARHLLSLAAEGSSLASDDAQSGLMVRMFKVDDGKAIPLDYQAGRTLRDGDKVRFRVENRGMFPLDVTLLFVDSGYGIECFWPRNRRYNRLFAGKQGIEASGTISAQETFGPEQLIAIGIRSPEGEPIDLCRLEQPTLERVRGREGANDSPLLRLLENALYGVDSVRGLEVAEIEDYTVSLVSWTVLPAEGVPNVD